MFLFITFYSPTESYKTDNAPQQQQCAICNGNGPKFRPGSIFEELGAKQKYIVNSAIANVFQKIDVFLFLGLGSNKTPNNLNTS